MSKRIINYLSILSLIIFFLLLIIIDYFPISYFSSPDNYFLFLVSPFIFLLSLFLTIERKNKKEILILILVLYSLFLSGIILNNSVYSVTFNGYRFGQFNLIPFKSIISTIKDSKLYGVIPTIKNFGFEILKFLPFIIILPEVFPKLKKGYLLIFIIAFLSITYEALEYVLGLGVLDIDDIILNLLFSSIFYLLISKTKLQVWLSKLLNFTFKKDKFGIETKNFTLKVSYKFFNVIYYMLFSLFLVSLTFNLIVCVSNLGNKVTVSGLINCNNAEYLITEKDNYRFYSTCKGNFNVVVNNLQSMSLEAYILGRAGNIPKEVEKKFNIRKEAVFTNIKVKENNLLGKIKIRNNTYFYNIEDISFQKDGTWYSSYKEYLQTGRYLSYYEKIDRILENVYVAYDFSIAKGKGFNKLTCYNSNSLEEYYLSSKYKITNNTCKFLKNTTEK